MKFILYEDPQTRRFAFVSVPRCFLLGDIVDVPAAEHWYATREDALASVAELLDRGESVTIN